MPALIATVGADVSPFRRELREAENIAQTTGGNIERNLESGAGGLKNLASSGVLREFLVLMREISRGNWSRVPGSLSILVQRLDLLKYLLTPLAALFFGVAAAVAFLAFGLNKAAAATEAYFNINGRLVTLLRHEAEAMERVAEAARAQAEWLRHLDDRSVSLTESTNERIRAMRQEFDIQQRMARARGQTAQEQHTAEVEQDHRELSVLHEAVEAARRKADQTRAAEIAASNSNVDMQTGAPHTQAVKDQAEAKLKILEALNADIEKQKHGLFNSWGVTTDNPVPHFFSDQELKQQPRWVTGPNGSEIYTHQAYAKWDYDQTQANYLAHKAREDASAQNLQDAKEAAEKAKHDLESLSTEERRMADRTRADEAYQPEERRRIFRGNVNSLQQVGAYTPAASVELLDVQKKIERHVARISNNVEHAIHMGTGRGVRH